MHRFPLFALMLAFAGCIDVPWSTGADEPPAASQTDVFPPDATLADGLEMIRTVLDSAIANRLEDPGEQQLMRAEALTDRVLETQLPFGWLAAQNYSVEARVWQLQAQADRIVARLRAGARREDLLPEAEALLRDVTELHSSIAGGGEAPPPSIDQLLRQLDSTDRRST